MRVWALCLALLLACEQPQSPVAPPPAAAPALPADLALSTRPSGASEIVDLKQTAKVGDAVTIEGVVGGRDDPFVAGRASLLVSDTHLLEKCLETCAEGDVPPAGFG